MGMTFESSKLLMYIGSRSAAGMCELIDHRFENGQGDISPFSLPRCGNVYILPGIPALLQQKWKTLRVRADSCKSDVCEEFSVCTQAACHPQLPRR